LALGGGALGAARRAVALPATWDPAAAAAAFAPGVDSRATPGGGGARRPAPRPSDLTTPYVGDRPPRVTTPNGSALTGRRAADGAWVYELTVDEVEHEFAPGLTATCWGYNGQVHGPTFEAV